MKFYHLTFFSKIKTSLQLFFLIFYSENSVLKFKPIKKYFQRKTSKSFFTILKSPHANKTAQEQFELRKNSMQLSISQPKNLKYLYYLKKLKNSILSDVNLKVKFVSNSCKNESINLSTFNSKKFVINKFQSCSQGAPKSVNALKKPSKINLVLFLKTFCVFGELKILKG